jgi:isoleucyl-tRNA synthetase
MDRHGADAVRWFMLAGGSPWSARRVGHKNLEEIASKVLRTYWSIASFQSLYARANGWGPDADGATGTPRSDDVDGSGEHALDRWALAETRRVAAEVDAALEAYDPARAGRVLAGLIDDLSNWYVRRCRRRFWDGDPRALSTLHHCLNTLTLLLAPFVPFVTERVWQALFASSTGVSSVHLARWPAVAVDAERQQLDRELSDQVALVRRIVELGRAARAGSAMKTRQPLARALVSAAGWSQLPDELRSEVTDELNVVELANLADAGELIDLSVKPNFRALGARFGARTKLVAAAITSADPTALVHALRAGSASVRVDDEVMTLGPDDLIVSETPRSGWAVASEGSETVALDLELTGELRRLGLLRDVVRFVQETRKNADLEVTDRIELYWQVGGSPEPAVAIREHVDELAREVLALSVIEGPPPASAEADFAHASDPDLGLRIWLKASPRVDDHS